MLQVVKEREEESDTSQPKKSKQEEEVRVLEKTTGRKKKEDSVQQTQSPEVEMATPSAMTYFLNLIPDINDLNVIILYSTGMKN